MQIESSRSLLNGGDSIPKKDRPVMDQAGQTAQGHQTNIAGGVQGSVFSGQLSGPVAQGGDANDFRGATIYKPTYNYNFPKPEEISRLPFIPDPPSDFTGRDGELRELQAKFEAGKNIIGLRGIGGVGKTALALKLVESLKDRYPDGQIMVDMKGTTDPKSPMEAMGDVIRSYFGEEMIPDSEDKTWLRYLEVLKDKRTLLLLDNALDDKQVLKLIPPKSCGLIITSRRSIKIPGLFKKDLDVLKPEEAVDLLLNVCCPAVGPEKSSREDPAWPEITRLCGYLPLALRAAASYLANSEDVSPARYASDLKDEKRRLEKIGEQGVEMSVDASFSLSFQKLEPKLQQTFLDLSVFPGDFDSQAEEQICQDHGHEGLSELLRWSFVDYKPQDQDYGRYRLHDLARLFASARQSDESKAIISERHCSYYRELLSAADDLYQQGGKSIQAALALFDIEYANIALGYSWAAKNAGSNPPAAQLCMRYPDAGAHVLYLRLNPMQRISWLKAALVSAEDLKDRVMESVHLGNLGLAYAALGDSRKAIEYYEQALEIARENGERRNESAWLGNLGVEYKNLGETRKAIEYHKQALEMSQEIGDRRGEESNLGNLGSAYAALSNARKAIVYYEQALEIAQEIGDLMGGEIHLGNLGLAYADLGDARKAIEYYEQALAIDRDISDRRGEGADLGNLGSAYYTLGETSKAKNYYQKQFEITRGIGDKRGEGFALWGLAICYEKMDDPEKAINNAKEALKIFEQIESPSASTMRELISKWQNEEET